MITDAYLHPHVRNHAYKVRLLHLISKAHISSSFLHARSPPVLITTLFRRSLGRAIFVKILKVAVDEVGVAADESHLGSRHLRQYWFRYLGMSRGFLEHLHSLEYPFYVGDSLALKDLRLIAGQDPQDPSFQMGVEARLQNSRAG